MPAMLEPLAILTPIALLDSASIVPICIVILVVLLAGPHPVFRSCSLIFGIFAAYLTCGLLILLGLESVLEEISAYTLRLWKNPETEEIILQILIGSVLCGLAVRMARSPKKRAEKPKSSGMTAAQAFAAGAALTVVGLPGAVPYLAAIDLILREDLDLASQLMVLGYYNAVFVAPLGGIVALRVAFGDRSQDILDGMRRFFETWGQRVVVVLFLVLGFILVVDGLGWLLGYPLIPV